MASAAFKYEYVPPNSSNNLGLLFCLILLLWSVECAGGGWRVACTCLADEPAHQPHHLHLREVQHHHGGRRAHPHHGMEV